MNSFFEQLGELWVKQSGGRGGPIEAPELTPQIAEELLQLARVAAHSRERSFAPLVSFTAGVAAERLRQKAPETSPQAVVEYLRSVRLELEREAANTQD